MKSPKLACGFLYGDRVSYQGSDNTSGTGIVIQGDLPGNTVLIKTKAGGRLTVKASNLKHRFIRDRELFKPFLFTVLVLMLINAHIILLTIIGSDMNLPYLAIQMNVSGALIIISVVLGDRLLHRFGVWIEVRRSQITRI